MDKTYEKLGQKGRIGRLELKNRLVMPAMGTSLAMNTGEASDEIIEYYRQRAAGGAGLIITEITRIDDETGIGTANQLAVTDTRHIPRLMRLAEAIQAEGSKLFVQLHHPGRQTYGMLLHGKKIVAPSEVTSKAIGEEPRALETEEVEALVKQFVKGAVIAQTAGVDGVEIHAAHGYLVSQFLSPDVNKRTDKYGGSLANRLRFLTEIVMGIRMTCGPHFPISVRINAQDFVEGGLTLEESIQVAKHLESLKIDLLNVSCGTYESGATCVEPSSFPEGWRSDFIKVIRNSVSLPILAVNNIKHPEFAEQMISSGLCDFVGIGRGHLADPEFSTKDSKLVRKCIGCLQCFMSLSEGRSVECTVNPLLGRELHWGEHKLQKDGAGRTAAVIGAGPAGVQASLVLAKRGFKVVLFEEADRVGGTLIIGSVPPHKELLAELIDTFEAELEAAGVDVRLNTPGTVEACQEIGAEVVFMATGGAPIQPPIPGIEQAVFAEDVLSFEAKFEGKTISVIGGGVTGLETAEVLASKNNVRIVEMLDDVGAGIYASAKILLLKRLQEAGAEILTEHRLDEIKAEEILVTIAPGTEEEEQKKLETDVVVLALGVNPKRPQLEEFEDEFNVILIGDAKVPGNILSALHDGQNRAMTYRG